MLSSGCSTHPRGSDEWGTCGLSRRCTCWSRAADGRSVAETTMRASEVVVLEPGEQVKIAFLGVGPVTSISPFPQGGLDEAFGLAVGAWSIGAGEAVAEAELGASLAELVGAIATSVIGEQGTDGDAMLGVKSNCPG